jgi:hypothetical protein
MTRQLAEQPIETPMASANRAARDDLALLVVAAAADGAGV